MGGDLYSGNPFYYFFFNAIILYLQFSEISGVTAHMLRAVAITTSLAAHTVLLEGLDAVCGICSQEDTHPSDL